MQLSERIDALVRWGAALEVLVGSGEQEWSTENHPLGPEVIRARQENPWFTFGSIEQALFGILPWLDRMALTTWAGNYPGLTQSTSGKSVGLILAGNIPLVGFHDVLTVLLSGHSALIKLSSDDRVLLPFLLKILFELEPRFSDSVRIVHKLENPDAVIATGSNNSARYFEYYFGKYPHIIRRNRTSVAVLTGEETDEDLRGLCSDIYSYFGLGCRNVSKLYVPVGYDFDRFFKVMENYGFLMQHNKYMNNYDYHRALFLLNKEPFLTNNFLLLREHPELSTPVSVLHFERYSSKTELDSELKRLENGIQCVVGTGFLPFGSAQCPGPMDYSDGVDTMRFLIGLH